MADFTYGDITAIEKHASDAALDRAADMVTKKLGLPGVALAIRALKEASNMQKMHITQQASEE